MISVQTGYLHLQEEFGCLPASIPNCQRTLASFPSTVRNMASQFAASAALTILLTVTLGCHTTSPAPETRVPTVSARFSPVSGITSGEPQHLGLAVQCDSDPVMLNFSERLAGVLAKEIELVTPGVRAVAWQPTSLFTSPIHEIRQSEESDVVTVAFQEPQSITPPDSAIFTDLIDPGVPTPGKCLQVRVLEFRPWTPMSASVRLTIIDGDTLHPIAVTTASWTAATEEDALTVSACDDCDRGRFIRTDLNGSSSQRETGCSPGPGHNSPEALTQVIASQIAAWYATESQTSLPPLVSP